MKNLQYQQFTDDDMLAFASPSTLGVLATVNDQGQPHLTCITTLQAADNMTLIWGQFAQGLSKQFILNNHRTAFFLITPQGRFWLGRAEFTKTATSGPEFDMYNNQPMFRYNAYFGVHTVYYMNLVNCSGPQSLPKLSLLQAAAKTRLAKRLTSNHSPKQIINPWTQNLIDTFQNLKLLAYITEDNYPVVIPAIHACPFDSEHIDLADFPFHNELAAIPDNTTVALWAMSTQLENVLLRGRLQRNAPLKCLQIDIDWIYNSMPPTPGVIYPPQPLEPVRQFDDISSE